MDSVCLLTYFRFGQKVWSTDRRSRGQTDSRGNRRTTSAAFRSKIIEFYTFCCVYQCPKRIACSLKSLDILCPVYCGVVLIGRNADLARPSVRLSIRPSVRRNVSNFTVPGHAKCLSGFRSLRLRRVANPRYPRVARDSRHTRWVCWATSTLWVVHPEQAGHRLQAYLAYI